jgi:hypothetical protein
MATKKQPSGDAAFEQFKADLNAALEEGERDIRAGRVVTADQLKVEMEQFWRELRRRKPAKARARR